jgi:hypothetical protein
VNASAPSQLSIEVVFEEVQEALSRARKLGAAKARKIARWPVVLCGLVALGAGGAALTASPVGEHQALRPYTSVARAHAATGLAVAELVAAQGVDVAERYAFR